MADPFVAEIRIFPFNFALPDLQGSAPMHPGQGPGLSLHDLGEIGGSETVTVLESEMPAHTHALMASTSTANRTAPAGNSFARVASGATPYIPASPQPPLTNLSDQALPPAGGSLPHNNMMPYLTLYFCIALQGVFPPRT
jgi:microcystin-dependent protein